MAIEKGAAGKRQRRLSPLREFHRAFLEIIRAEAQPAKMLARILRRKLSAQGVEIKASELPSVEALAAKILASGGGGKFELDLQSGRGTDSTAKIDMTPDDVRGVMDDFSDVIEEAIPGIAKKMSKPLLRALRKASPQTLAGARAGLDYTRQRLRAHWSPAFDQLAVEIAVAEEIAQILGGVLAKRRKGVYLIEALLRLHARACSTAHEVGVLLEAGLPDGALARWRTIHEATVIATFLKAHGDSVAERYLLHQDVEALRALQKYDELAPMHGWRSSSSRDVKYLERRVAALVTRFGPTYARRYGWATEVLGKKHPTFADIERAAELTYARPHYQMASGIVHVGPEEMVLKVGMVAESELIVLPGISDAGLDVAGRITAHSIGMMTIDLLRLDVTLDAVVWMEVMLSMTLETGRTFDKCRRRMERSVRSTNG